MNIFVLNENPYKSANMLCTKHLDKIIIDSCKLLCSVFYSNSDIIPPYKLTHHELNHPCAKWVRESSKNFDWLLMYLYDLLWYYDSVYSKEHECSKTFVWIADNEHKLKFSQYKLTPFIQYVPKQYQSENTIEAYIKYYICEKIKDCSIL